MLVPLEPGALIGPYQVVSLIGHGGMGEVYRAHDARLSRDVAVKVLPAAIAHNPIRRARFEHEARTISQLNHPNICAVYDIGTDDDGAYLVMEYIDGESLAQRLRRGPIPAATAIGWAIQIAAALDSAHRRGITHRDLKPANVMVAGDVVKLLDFGLATLRNDEDDVRTANRDDSTISLTAERSIVGTLHYMSPEQLEGRAIDARTDLFAFGSVLYEMLAARKAFSGESDASVIAAILTSQPAPVSSGESAVAPALEHVVQRAHAKNPDERWQTARDLMSELQWIMENGSRGIAVAARPNLQRSRTALLGVGVLALLAGVAARSIFWRSQPPAAALIHLSFVRPVGTELTNTGRPVLAISPDGKKIVFNANNRLYVRTLNAAEAIPIPGTQGTGVTTPFFSPDGRWVAFFAEDTDELKRIPVDGGAAVTICRSPGPQPGNFGASWSADNQLLFATRGGVFRISPDGGTPQRIVDIKPGETVYGPQMLPDGDHLLLTVTTASGVDRWDRSQIVAYSLSSRARTVLVEGGADARFVDSGHIIYAVGTTLFAVPLDVRSLRTLSAPVTVLSGVRRAAIPAVNTASAFFAVAKTGDLVYIPDEPQPFINVAVDLSGRRTALPDHGLGPIRVSPDGSRLLTIYEDGWWIYSLTRREAPIRLADAAGANTNPVWTPDGARIAFRSRTTSAISWLRADGTGLADTLLAVNGVPIAWSRDGKTLFYLSERQLWTWTNGAEPRALTTLISPYASLSPDGQWVAYHTSEHGKAIPYIQSLVNGGARFEVSHFGGHAPLWSPDGRKLFYVSGETNSLMVIDVQTTPAVVFGEPVAILPEISHGLALEERWYDVTPDGNRLVVEIPDRDHRSRQVEVVLNWTEELKQRVPMG